MGSDFDDLVSELETKLREEIDIAEEGEDAHRDGATDSEELDEAWAHYYCGKKAGLQEAQRLLEALATTQGIGAQDLDEAEQEADNQ